MLQTHLILPELEDPLSGAGSLHLTFCNSVKCVPLTMLEFVAWYLATRAGVPLGFKTVSLHALLSHHASCVGNSKRFAQAAAATPQAARRDSRT